MEMNLWSSPIHWTTRVSFLPRGFPPLSIPSLPQISASGWKASGQAGAGEAQISSSRSCRGKHLHRCGGVGVGVLRAGKGEQGDKHIRSATLNEAGPQRLRPHSSADSVAICSGQRPVGWVGELVANFKFHEVTEPWISVNLSVLLYCEASRRHFLYFQVHQTTF